MVRRREKQAVPEVTEEQLEAFASAADGGSPKPPKPSSQAVVGRSISLPKNYAMAIEDMAIDHKRKNGGTLKSASAVVLAALEGFSPLKPYLKD